MHQAFLDIKGVRTNVTTYGRWVEEQSTTNDDKANNIILLIPGNPGITTFYTLFMHILHEKTGYPVWILSHAGHEIPKNNQISPVPKLQDNQQLYGLEGQIQHKKDFLQNYIPKDATIHLIGHSIGAYIILELLKESIIPLGNVKTVNLLFPTIEEMATTPNGRFLNNFVKPIVWLILFLSWIYMILPAFLHNFLMFSYMKLTGIPKMHTKTLMKFINPDILDKVFFMAFDELEQVHQRNNTIIEQNLEKFFIIYGKSDGWTPIKYCEKLKTDYPNIRAQVTNYDHAFVLRHSHPVGNLVAENILNSKIN